MAPPTESIFSYLSDFYNAFSTAGEMKYHLANLLDIKEKQLQKAGSLGQRVMAQQMELEERVRRLQVLEAEKDKIILKAREQYRELAETILSWDSENVQLFSAFAGSLQPLKAFEAMVQFPDSALSQNFDHLFSTMGGTKLHLKNLLAGKEKQLQQASSLGQRIMAQQMKLDEYIRQLQELEADKDDDDEIGLVAREQYRELEESIWEWDSENTQLSIAFVGSSKSLSNSPNTPYGDLPDREDPELEPTKASAGMPAEQSQHAKNTYCADDDDDDVTSSSSRPATPPLSEDVEEVVPTPPTNLLPQDETVDMVSGAVQPPALKRDSPTTEKSHPSLAPTNGDSDDSEGTSYTEEDFDEEESDGDRLILSGGNGIPTGPDGTPKPLLPPISPHHAGRKCLILDLDETLVHSSFKSISQADYVVPVEVEYHWHNVYVAKRPGVDYFLQKMGEIYEVVVFTASLSKYVDPTLDKLDIHRVVSHRLFRESCYNHKGNYVKDLSQLGRPIADTILLDNSPASYIFHPNNAVPVSSWFNDPHDTELIDLVPFLTDLATVKDVRGVLDGAR